MSARPQPEALTPDLQTEIRQRFNRVAKALPGFVSRPSQRYLIGAVARALTVPAGVLVAEAPTGTGKSMAYLLAGLPVALALKRRLVIATATVALQEQLVLRDIPAFLAASGLVAKVVLAKGRQRYVCVRNLHELLQDDSKLPQGGLDFGAQSLRGQWPRAPAAGEVQTLTELRAALDARQWDGDLDRTPQPVAEASRRLITTSAGGCSNRRCPHLLQCPFVLARNHLQDAQIVVANHDLVLADLSLGADEDGSGGVLLPSPKESLYVFDEAHHLPIKAIERGSAELHLGDGRRRLARLAAPLRAAFLQSDKERIGRLRAEEVDELLDRLVEGYDALLISIQQAWQPASGESEPIWRALLGELPDDWRSRAQELQIHSGILVRWLPQALKSLLESDLPADRRETQARELSLAHERLLSHHELWRLWALEDRAEFPPVARWLRRAPDGDLILHASEVSAGPVLRRLLWSQGASVVLTSATLSLAGDFRNFAAQVGLPNHAETLCLPSPFDLHKQASLIVPSLAAMPDQADAHARAIAGWLDGELDWRSGNLVLFTSRSKLEATLAQLPEPRRSRVLAQGSRSKSALLEAHSAAVKAGLGSTLFGLASFGEGLDLPGQLCETVVITQLPFAVPTDPVGATYAEFLESRGRNAFIEVSIPQATRTLIQYCGRLIRGEGDRGRIVILDRRLVTKRYGGQILAALPGFARDIHP